MGFVLQDLCLVLGLCIARVLLEMWSWVGIFLFGPRDDAFS